MSNSRPSAIKVIATPGAGRVRSEAAEYKEVRSREGAVARVPETCVVTVGPATPRTNQTASINFETLRTYISNCSSSSWYRNQISFGKNVQTAGESLRPIL